MGTLNSWDVTDANNNATPPDGWPENTMQYSEVNDTGRAVQGTLKRFFADTNGSLQAGGVADAYTLTLNETGYSAYFAGMWFACEIMATNTGASTINVNGIGVQSIVDRAGNALTAGELQNGGIYEFRYDGTNFQLMGTVAGAVSVPSGVFTNSNNPDLVDTDVALNVGAADPTAAQHIEVGPSALQSKSDATTAAALAVNSLGGNLNLGAQSGTGLVRLYHDALIRANTVAGGDFEIRSDGDTDTETRRLILAHQDGTNRALLGHIANDVLQLRNLIDSGNVQIRGNNSSSTATTMISANPDGAVGLFQAGTQVFVTTANGADVNAPAANSAIFDVVTSLVAGTTNIGLRTASNGARLRVSEATGEFQLRQTDAAGSGLEDNWIQAERNGRVLLFFNGSQAMDTQADGIGVIGDGTDAVISIQNSAQTQIGFIRQFETATQALEIRNTNSGAVSLWHSNAETVRTTTAGAGGLLVNNTSTGGGFERVLTTSDAGGGGNVSNTGTPVNNQLAIWTNATTIEGDPNVTYDGTAFRILESTASQAALLRIEHSAAADGVQIAQRDNTFDDIELNRTNGAGTEGNTLIEWSIGDGTDLYDSGSLVARTTPAVSGGFEVDGNTIGGGFADVIVDQDETVIYGRQPNGGFVADGIGITTTTIGGGNADTYSGKCLQLSSGDTLRFASLSGWSGDEAGGTMRLGSGSMTIGASNISVDFWEAQASGITYHNLSGTSTFSVTGPGIGGWRYAGDAQAIGFIFAA